MSLGCGANKPGHCSNGVDIAEGSEKEKAEIALRVGMSGPCGLLIELGRPIVVNRNTAPAIVMQSQTVDGIDDASLGSSFQPVIGFRIVFLNTVSRGM